ncbi:GNAT family N-acetyltransferase [Pediococcus claussenii]|uniref:Acetyltransferase, GNAT family n=1 Tax=Pediococcus claussenii (strain ATCC BAA-344 / DSM 14800 / JCM 18046 / KCTC 3811 / LMG 21948 / P06) TaxID=701521 RepID=G8PC47_PEDCP|nr:GNAT family N-acetyltransferase [Pediococcus claussenii]AEV94866.1 acetyltransferase, GNAT family [Pediococcus claussenii ATCC BAA-344]ANZ70062.1 hypothetical protein AYR57_06910 [Pediococcus claussenii]ANZ71877.1 hypothetical protein AYR58_06910 [Pediococcus claussenii]KRN21044.1 hypothetical protein IV79_GL000270 [Pediococcus claussenii]
MSDEVGLREASFGDGEQIFTLFSELNLESDSLQMDDLSDRSISKINKQLAFIQSSSTNLILVATLGDELIGVITIIQSNSVEERTAELGVGVLKEYWHQGIGSMLVDEALYWAQNFSDLNSIWLDVFADNQYAYRIYQSMGFTLTKKAVQNGRRVIHMELEFN